MNEESFDQLLEEMRGEGASAGETSAATQRVRDRLAGADSALCAQFRQELDAHLANRLTDSKRLLLEDHLARCTGCRHALAEAKGRPQLVAMPAPRARKVPWVGWAVAAGLVLATFYAGRHEIDRAFAPSGSRATVVSVSGDAYALPELALAPGGELFEGDSVRTGAGARLILALADGSRVEVNQRTQLSVRSAWSGQTVALDYGDVLIEAAQSRGRLRVITRDSAAAVKGTVFAVSSATAGSLISVVEGSVEVSQSGAQKVLQPGQMAASSPALKAVRIEQAIAWSQEAEKYYGLLAEFVSLERELAALPGPSLRTQARLLQHLPAETVGYMAIPNLTGTIAQAVSLIEQRAAQNAELAKFWSSQEAQALREAAEHVETVAPLLGEELLFVFAVDPSRPGDQIPVLLAEIQSGREDDLRAAIRELSEGGDFPHEIINGLLLASDSAENLTIVSASLGGGASSDFAAEIAQRYEQGVSWLIAADIEALRSELSLDQEASLALGMATARYMFFEKRAGGAEEIEATLTFKEGRTGIATWLASPGPAGSAEYVSSSAMAAFSASTRDPRQALDELLALLGEDSELAAEIAEFEAETGISISLDIAASLGADVTFAMERPTIPVPGGFVAFETTNPGALDETARRLVERFNDRANEYQSEQSLIFAQEIVNGRSWRSIKLAGTSRDPVEEALRPVEIHWTYDRGYLVGSIDRALAMQAIAVRESGSALVHSDDFERSFPAMSTLHHSGFFWFNTRGVASDLASLVTSPALKSLLGSREPVLVVFDGEPERIHAASRTRLTSVLLDAVLLSGVGQSASASDVQQP